MAGSPEDCGEGPFFVGDLGVLRNISKTYGVGATFSIAGDDCGGRYAFRPRFRWWLAEQAGLDLAVGIVLGDDDYNSSYKYPAFSGMAAFDVAGLIAPFYQLEMYRTQSRTDWKSYAGFRASSYAAPLVTILLGILVAATWN